MSYKLKSKKSTNQPKNQSNTPNGTRPEPTPSNGSRPKPNTPNGTRPEPTPSKPVWKFKKPSKPRTVQEVGVPIDSESNKPEGVPIVTNKPDKADSSPKKSVTSVKNNQNRQKKKKNSSKQIETNFRFQKVQNGQRISSEDLRDLVIKIKNRLMTKKGRATYAEILSEISQEFNVNRFEQIGLGKPWHVPILKGIQEMENKVTMFIEASLSVCSLYTISDLESELKTYLKVQDITELFMTSVLHHPAVQRKILVDEVRDTTRAEVLGYLEQYMKKSGRNKKKMIDAKVFHHDFAEFVGVDYQNTGIIIRSIPHCIQMISTAKNQENKFFSRLKKQWKDDYQAEEYIKAYKKEYLAEKQAGGKMPIQKWRNNATTYIDLIIRECGSTKYKVIFEAIVNSISSSSQCRSILCICAMYAKQKMEESENEEATKSFQVKEIQEKIDIEFDIIQSRAREYLESKPEPTIENLADLEKYLIQIFRVKNFSDLGYGSFISFLYEDFEDFLQQSGSTLVPPEILYDFASQCLNSTPISQLDCYEKIQRAICSHYGVKDLSFVSNLEINQIMKHAEDFSPRNIIFQESLLQQEAEETYDVGLLGHISEEQLLQSLDWVPYLTNLSEWLCWDDVYQIAFGNMREYLQSLDNFLFMETSPGVIFKLDHAASKEKFRIALSQRNAPQVATQLVSLITKRQNIADFSLSLYRDYLKTTLLKMKDISEDGLYYFVLELMTNIPTKILLQIASDFLLKPLSETDVQYKKKILDYCTSKADIMMLHKLGLNLNIGEWKASFKNQVIERDTAFQEFAPKREIVYQTIEKEIQVVQKIAEVSSEIITKQEVKTETEIIVPESSSYQYEVVQQLAKDYEGGNERMVSGFSNSLERLSSQLYSRDIHFVLELVQNADDNTYNDENPSLQITITPNSFVIENNEVGFSERNIKALCSVGDSTKTKENLGYIGQKGIGFKSVFRVTDAPEIHSNGYHIKFDKNSGKLGYISPIWIDVAEEEFTWATTIKLPINEKKIAKVSDFSRQFEDINPSILLFLNRLKHIRINDQIQGIEREMQKDFIDDHIVEVSHDLETFRWMVVKKVVQQPGLRDDADQTVIQLAFPLASDHTQDSPYQLPDYATEQNVFAYLPLREVGFKFIIQGDFIVPSSRQDVDNDEPWNQAIRDEISNVFMEAISLFKEPPKVEDPFSQSNFYSNFFQFLPSEGEVVGFFKTVVKDICSKMKSVECIPTQSDEWVMPHQAVIVSDVPLIKVVKEKITELTERSFVREDVVLTNAQIKSLGINTFTGENLPGLLVDFYKSIKEDLDGETLNYDDISNEDKQWIVDSLLYIDTYIEQSDTKAFGIRTELLSLRLIPLDDGTLTCLNDGHLFIPEESSNFKSSASSTVYSHLRIINESFINLDKSGKLKDLLEKLGATKISPEVIIDKAVFPYFQKFFPDENTDDTLVIKYMTYLKDFSSTLENPAKLIAKIKQIGFISTNKGIFQIDDDHVYIPSHYAEKKYKRSCLDSAFPFLDVILVSTAYGKGKTVDSWRTFFVQLGFTFHVTLRKTIDGAWDSEEIRSILGQKKKALEEFHQMIALHWASYYRNFIKTKEGEDTAFVTLLKSSAWLTSTEGDIFVPTDLFFPRVNLQELLGASVPYVNTKTDMQFYKDVGVITILNSQIVLDILVSWSKLETVPKSITSDLIPLNLYTYLMIQTPDFDSIVKAFRREAIFFAPKNSRTDRCFYRYSEVLWNDPTLSIDEWGKKRVLSGLYKKRDRRLEEFFQFDVQISLYPTFSDYIDVFLLVKDEADSEELRVYVYKLFSEWWDFTQSPKYNGFNFNHQLRVAMIPMFCTTNGEWVPFSELCFLVENDTQLEDSLIFEDSVFFLDTRGAPDKVKNFLKTVMQVRSIGKSLKPIVLNNQGIVNSEIQSQVSQVLSYLQQFVFSTNPDTYERLKETNISSKLHSLSVEMIPELSILYDLQGIRSQFTKKKICIYDDDSGKLLINEPDFTTLDDDIYRYLFSEISKMIFDEISWELAEFGVQVSSYLQKNKPQKLQFYLENRRIKSIPFGDEKWEIISSVEEDEVLSESSEDIINFGDFDEAKYERVIKPRKILEDPVATSYPSTAVDVSEKQAKMEGSPQDSMPTSVSDHNSIDRELQVPKLSDERENLRSSNSEFDNKSLPDQENQRSCNSEFDNKRLPSGQSGGTTKRSSRVENWAHNNVESPSALIEKTLPEVFEEFSPEISEAPQLIIEGDDQSNIGIWGEEYVYLYLQKKFPEMTVEWVNELEESGRPYDLKITHNNSVKYIEVKTTTTNIREQFNISLNELEFSSECDKYNQEFEIYRVCNAGKQSISIGIFPCPVILLREDRASLIMRVTK